MHKFQFLSSEPEQAKRP